jgi:hypothetical protein
MSYVSFGRRTVCAHKFALPWVPDAYDPVIVADPLAIVRFFLRGL